MIANFRDSRFDEVANQESEVVPARIAPALIWQDALPDTRGARQYTLLIRAPDDERFEARRRGRAAGGQLAWRAALSEATREQWLKAMRRVLSDGSPRTFNRIVLEASGGKYTADIAAGKAPEAALWTMLHQKELEWANHPERYVVWRAKKATPL